MAIRNTATGWGLPARVLHWGIGLLIIGMLAFGFYLTNAFNDGDPAKLGLVQWHKSFGFTVFALALVRILWRVFNPTPALPDGMSALERMGAHVSHIALYVLMFVLPLSGWLMSSASPFNDPGAYPMQIKNMVFGLFEMPDPINPGDRDLEVLFHAVHEWAAIGLAVLLLAHVGAALKHHLVNRDTVLTRMWRG